MTVKRGFALSLICVLAAFMADTTGSAESPAAPTVHLKSITSRMHAKGASLIIEATEPAPYVTSRPDPLTVVLDFRGVDGESLGSSLSSAAGGPIARVRVEATDLMGARSSRVRIALTQPVAHNVRSERNTVIVDFERGSGDAAPYVPPPAARDLPDAMEALARADRASARTDQQSAAIAALGVSSVAAAAAPSVKVVTAAAPVANQAAPAGAATAPQAGPPAVPPDLMGRPGRVYTGNPVSLDFQGADLRAVLRMFSEISGLNIVIDPAVQGSVDVVLKDVPWDQALDLILRSNKLGYLVDGTIVRIAPLSVLADEEGLRRKLSDEQALAGELRVLTRTLSYARAEELQNLLTRSALSPRGTVQVDPRTNTLIITDLADRLNTATDLINTLDKAQPQVEIEARIVQTNREYARALGVQWGFSGRVDPSLGNTTNLAFPNSGSLSGRTGQLQGPAGQPTAVNLPADGATTAVGLALGSVNGAFNLDVALSAMEKTQQRPAAVDSARRDSEQRRGRNHARNPDSRSDRRQQHRHDDVQGRRAVIEGHAADHGRGHRDHEYPARKRFARSGAARHRSLDQHTAREHDGARPGRRDHRHRRHLFEQFAKHDGRHSRAESDPSDQMVVQARDDR